MSDVSIDGSTQLAPGGGPDTNNAPGSKGRKTMKWHIGVDANGIGLGALIASGPANDYPLLQPTLDVICERDWTATIGTLHLDRGYGYPSLPTKLVGHQIDVVNVTMRNMPRPGTRATRRPAATLGGRTHQRLADELSSTQDQLGSHHRTSTRCRPARIRDPHHLQDRRPPQPTQRQPRINPLSP